MPTIFIIEDNPDINTLLAKILSSEGSSTISAFSGTEALLLLKDKYPDLILLDLMLPGLSGEELLVKLRNDLKLEQPIIVISAKTSLSSKVELLRLGADDYITKPFEPEEVLARINANLRRSSLSAKASDKIAYKNIKIYPDSRKALVFDTELTLTAHEYDILALLITNPNKVYSREILYEIIWQGGYYGENNTVNVHISNIRKKLKELDSGNEYIKTVYGIGFKLE